MSAAAKAKISAAAKARWAKIKAAKKWPVKFKPISLRVKRGLFCFSKQLW
jgi:hypothetical protein